PGAGIDPAYIESAKSNLADQTQSLMEKSSSVGKSLWPGIVEVIVPRNMMEAFTSMNMLAIIFVSILIGAALLKASDAKARVALDVLSAISSAMITLVGWIMYTAPLAVGCLMFNAVLQFDIQILGQVAK